MRFLGVDVGTKKTGLAITDEGGKIAFPHSTVSTDILYDSIIRITKELGIKDIVFGESLNFKRKENEVMLVVRKIVSKFDKNLFNIYYSRECFSTQQAKRLGKGVDEEAAAIILQSFVDNN